MTYRPNALSPEARDIVVRVAHGESRRRALLSSGAYIDHTVIRVGSRVWAILLREMESLERSNNFVLSADLTEVPRPRIMGMDVELDQNLETDQIRICLEVDA